MCSIEPKPDPDPAPPAPVEANDQAKQLASASNNVFGSVSDELRFEQHVDSSKDRGIMAAAGSLVSELSDKSVKAEREYRNWPLIRE
jgi:hypothetical protein